MKKIFAMLLVCLMVVGMFAGCGNANTEEKGSVYYLNFKPEADEAWQKLAKEYTELTGVQVKVVTAASGEYSTYLNAEMSKSDAPTLFQCGNAQGLLDWDDYCLDLTGTKVLGEMTTSDFNLKNSKGEVKAIGYCLSQGQPGDVIVLAGKGHEVTQEVDGVYYPMDERKIVAECFQNPSKAPRLGSGNLPGVGV